MAIQKHRSALALIVILLFVASSVVHARQTPKDELPSQLETWKKWVLHGQEDNLCPSPYNDSAVNKCMWPSRLVLDLEESGGVFTQEWSVFVEGEAPLPGGEGMWPADVLVDGSEAPVFEKRDQPCVRLTPGAHELKGVFKWDELPEIMHIPAETGIVELKIRGETIDFPRRDPPGRLWIKRRQRETSLQDTMEIRVVRLLRDTIPMQVDTRLELLVSGNAREAALEEVLLQGSIPMTLKCPMPARFDSNGRLLIQVRPGHWNIEILSRVQGQVKSIGPVAAPYGRETWSFEPHNHLRMVKVDGAAPVDPSQTEIPADWRRFQTFLVPSGATLRFKEIRRGNPDPAPDRLSLRRTWWLDFDGGGYTVSDVIDGTMSRNWSLGMNPPFLLGRVQVDGVERLITRQGDKKSGVELRKGELHLRADSRYESEIGRLPAVGWDHDFQSVSASLNLPPGWRLFAAEGVDVIPGTWIEDWTLLDLFVILLVAMAVLKLRGWKWGLAALITLGLIYQEPGAPKIIWLHLLGAMAVLRLLSGGWFRRLIQVWFVISAVVLVGLAAPFLLQQIRVGMYPQLERVHTYPVSGALNGIMMKQGLVDDKPAAAPQETETLKYSETRQYTGTGAPKKSLPGKQAALVRDPDALVQTGPGVPSWKWRSITMKWNGPVESDQVIRLWLVRPEGNMVLCFSRAVLLTILIAGLLGMRKEVAVKKGSATALLALCVLLVPCLASARQAENGGPYPPKWMLEELERRLLEPDTCFPICADIPRMILSVEQGRVRFLLEAHAEIDTAIPLPGDLGEWSPQSVVMDGKPVKGLYRDNNGILWMLLPRGIHRIVMSGMALEGKSFKIGLPLRPRHASVVDDTWDIQGIRPDGTVEGSLQLTPRRMQGAEGKDLKEAILQPFLSVQRELHLGLNWGVVTRVSRRTPPGDPVVVSIPLLEGESLHTEGIRVQDNRAMVHMGPGTSELQWVSSLEKADLIELKAPESVLWTETWILDASPIWHCEPSGIPVIHHQDKQGFWKPEWRPWPGEVVRIAVSKPPPVPGPSITIDRAHLTFTPGRRFDKGVLSVTARASKGGSQRITLPDDAGLQVVKIDGATQPIRMQGDEIVIPIQPGKHVHEIEWHQKTDSLFLNSLRGVDLGRPAVNAGVTFKMPPNRWILFTGGPRLGPAVLFWTYLGAVVLIAVFLGRIRWTPLKAGHWILLGLGLTQVHPLIGIMIVGWFLFLGRRPSMEFDEKGWFRFDATQVLLVLWTIASFVGMYLAIQKGLVGIPDMQIAGNASSSFQLNWTQDRIMGNMPCPWVLSVPVLCFRILMLLWALWLVYCLTGWLQWAWGQFSEKGLWRSIRKTTGHSKNGVST